MTGNEIETFMGKLAETVADKPEDRSDKMILAALTELGGAKVQEDDIVFQGTKFVLPGQYRGALPKAISFLQQLHEQQKEEHNFDRVFKYRPNDVAAALMATLKQIWGTTGVGQATYSFFGKQNPTFRTIDVGYRETMQVPDGWTQFPPLEGQIAVGGVKDPELGSVGIVRVECPRRHRAAVEGLFIAMERYMETGSIYKGRAITGGNTPTFMNTATVNPADVVYTEEVMRQLEANVWVLIEHAEKLQKLGVPLKRAVLLEGPYGTGKSLAGMLTAQKAVDNGWTYIFCRPQDNLETVMRTAQMYAPAVVFFEDIDVVADENDPTKISRLLDTFDGITSKGVPVIGVLTTNNVDKIHKGMLRPGRMDAVIHIGALDQRGVQRLVEAKLGAENLMDVDYGVVYKAFEGFVPAFAAEAIDRVRRYGIARNKGQMPEFFTTEDLVAAAEGLRPQLDLMNDAKEAEKLPTIDRVFEDLADRVTERVVNRTEVQDGDGDKVFALSAEDED